MDGWEAVSSDPEVFTIEHQLHVPAGEDSETDYLVLDVNTVGEGMADLQIQGTDGEEAAALFDVRVPDAAELHAAAPLFVQTRDVPTYTRAPRILDGGQATYQVVWMSDGEPLAGNGTLDVVPADATVETDTEQTWFFEDRDWVHIWGMTPGESSLSFASNGIHVVDVPVTVVPETDLDHLEIYGVDERGHEEGEWLAVMAQAYDAEDRAIHGVDYDWTRDGASELGSGDLYRYEYVPDNPVRLGADRGALHAETDIHAGLGFVDSSNNVGCAHTGTAGIGAAAISLLAARRRRDAAARR